MNTVDFLSKEGVATLWQTIKDYAVANDLLAQPSGVATLDEFGKVLQTQLPDYILGQVLFGGTIDGNGVATLTTLFKNRYNLSVDTLDVDNLTAANYEGSYFIATANGVSGIAKTLDIVVGDWVISNGSEWTKIDNTDAVRTVLGLKGDIQAPDLRNAMLGKSGNQGSNLALGTIWMGNGDGTVVTHNTSAFARSLLASIAENTMFSKLWADRATNDGNGKNIANTYMPFAGGTFTGDVTHSANLILANSKVIAGKDTSGSNVSLLSINTSNQVVIGYGAHNKYDTLLYGKHIYAYGDIYGQKGVSAKGIADFGLSGGGGGGTAYTLNIVPSDSKVSIQLKGADGSSDTKEISIFSTSQAGVVPKSNGTSSLLFGSGWRALQASDIPSLDWSKITNVTSIFTSESIYSHATSNLGVRHSVSNNNGSIALYASGNRGLYDETNEKWVLGTDGNNSFLMQGNVGIGTTAPKSKLHVNGELSTPAYLNFLDKSNNAFSYIGRGGSAATLTIMTYGAENPIQFGTNSQMRMTISAGGRVGIGTADPQYKLDVNGNLNATEYSSTYQEKRWIFGAGVLKDDSNYFIFTDATSYKAHLTIDSNNSYVGIGTRTPQYNLDVNGSFNATTLYQNGSTLDNTYLKLSGGILTGDIKTKSFWSGTDSLGLFIEGKSNTGVRIQYNKSTTGNDYDTLKLKNGIISWNDKTILHAGNTALTLDAAYNWEDKDSQTNKQVYGFTLNVNGTEIGMSAITKEELMEMLR